MLSYLYELIMSFVTLVLGFFGIDMKKKSVSFADDNKTDTTDTTDTAESISIKQESVETSSD
jgi:hypothetical protein